MKIVSDIRSVPHTLRWYTVLPCRQMQMESHMLFVSKSSPTPHFMIIRAATEPWTRRGIWDSSWGGDAVLTVDRNPSNPKPRLIIKRQKGIMEQWGSPDHVLSDESHPVLLLPKSLNI